MVTGRWLQGDGCRDRVAERWWQAWEPGGILLLVFGVRVWEALCLSEARAGRNLRATKKCFSSGVDYKGSRRRKRQEQEEERTGEDATPRVARVERFLCAALQKQRELIWK